MPFPNEHAARLVPPGRFVRFSRVNDAGGSGVDFIYGHKFRQRREGDSELQAIRFDRKKFTTAQAKAWLKKHDFKPTLFEPATGRG